jgi:selenocysteine-specific elongation factor
MHKNVIIGTAGHIDHGKSSLVEALTGVHPDRLKEEKERGITIDLGFANLQLNDRIQIGFVDVPGHERFIKNMLAGVGGIDAVLLVVAADESIMPQTREHFDICQLLNLRAGLVAITKADLIDAESLEVVKLEVQEFIAASFLQGAPVVPVSARTGMGISTLKERLSEVCESTLARDTDAVLRLPIDRCFTLHGFGTVVTGTLLSGTVRKEDEVEIYPVKIKSRVRGLQVHSTQLEEASAGQRTAINLTNVEVSQIHRGMEVSVPGRFQSVTRCDAEIEILSSSPVHLIGKTQVRFHLGTSELMATLKPIGTREIQPGRKGLVRVQLERPILMLPGDRFIFRRLSPMVTLGGGSVLDIEPAKLRSNEKIIHFLKSIESLELQELICRQAERHGMQGLGEFQILAHTIKERRAVRAVVDRLVSQGRLRLISEDPSHVMDPASFAHLTASVLSSLEDFHRRNPLVSGIPREQLQSSNFKQCHPLAFRAALSQLSDDRKIVIENDLVRLTGKTVVLDEAESAAKTKIEKIFLEAGLKAPAVDDVLEMLSVSKDQTRKLMALLIKEKQLIKISENFIFHSESIQRIRQLLAEQKKETAQIDVGKFKDLTGISRKYAIPLLEYFDRERVTRRIGDHRLIL